MSVLYVRAYKKHTHIHIYTQKHTKTHYHIPKHAHASNVSIDTNVHTK